MWLKHLAEELQGEGARIPEEITEGVISDNRYEGLPLQLTTEVADRTLIARLELDPQSMSYVRLGPRVRAMLTYRQ